MTASPDLVLLLAPARPPDRLGQHLLLTLVIVLAIALGYLGMWRGWRRRAERVRSLPPLPDLVSPRPEPLPEPLVPPMPGIYVGSVGEGGWQDRIAGRGLGRRAGGELLVTDTGVDLAGLWLPRTSLASVRIGPGLANKVVPGPGMVIVGWDWDGSRCESAFRGQASRYPEIVAAVETLLTGAPC